MRHSAVTMAQWVLERVATGESWDILFCSDMLPLAEFRGLVGMPVAGLPAIFYFHENQLTYPVQHSVPAERDCHFAFTNFVSALAANRVWFNSHFHRREFSEALGDLLNRMPDFAPVESLERMLQLADVQPPGIVPGHEGRPPRKSGPLRILWAARWEYDKGPAEFFEAMGRLKDRIPLELHVLGQSFQKVPDVFHAAHRELRDQIVHWGHVSEDDYRSVLQSVDVFVSTARHEFFGIAALEAAAAGVLPVLPRRLAYPEVFSCCDWCFYDGSVSGLVTHLEHRNEMIGDPESWKRLVVDSVEAATRFAITRRSREMDAALEEVVASSR